MAKNKPEAYGALRPWQRARAWVDRVTTRKAGWVSWVLAVALVLCGVAGAGLALHWYYLAVREAFGIARDASLFGDAFGAFAALASALATIGIVAALLLQQKQLTLQREELALQRAEMRAAREEHRKAADAQTESARAARAQVAAFGAQGVDRFLTDSNMVLRRFRDIAHRLEHAPKSLTVEHSLLVLSVDLPRAPIFCSNPIIVQASFIVQNLLESLAEILREAWDAGALARNTDVAQSVRNSAATEFFQLLKRFDEQNSDVVTSLRSLEKLAGDWFLRAYEDEAVESGERPVTTPEEQAS